jgi:hypothetical protein
MPRASHRLLLPVLGFPIPNMYGFNASPVITFVDKITAYNLVAALFIIPCLQTILSIMYRKLTVSPALK